MVPGQDYSFTDQTISLVTSTVSNHGTVTGTGSAGYLYTSPFAIGDIRRIRVDNILKTEGNNFYLLSSVGVYDQPISVGMKKTILKKFNQRPDNVYGEYARFIIMDSGFKEGIDLFDIKYVHIFEPQTSLADQKQVIGKSSWYHRVDDNIVDLVTGETVENPKMVPWMFCYKAKDLPLAASNLIDRLSEPKSPPTSLAFFLSFFNANPIQYEKSAYLSLATNFINNLEQLTSDLDPYGADKTMRATLNILTKEFMRSEEHTSELQSH